MFLNRTVKEKDRKMQLLLSGLSDILTTEQKAMLFPIAREWVDGDMITKESINFVEFGERNDIKSLEWDTMRQEMLDNFITKEDDLRRFE